MKEPLTESPALRELTKMKLSQPDKKVLLAALDLYKQDLRETGESGCLHDHEATLTHVDDLVDRLTEVTIGGQEVKRYLIHEGDYFGVVPNFEEFTGTLHDLLIHLCCVDIDDWIKEFGHKPTNEELIDMFHDMNGDGQPWWDVYCLDDSKHVLPTEEFRNS